MALLGSTVTGEVGLRLLLCPLGSNVVIRTACCSVGIALPVYSTCRAIEKKDLAQQQKWLLYWAAYGSFSLVEVFSDKLLSWFPLYYHVKFAFLVWLQLPTVDGAKQLYTGYLRPFCLRHHAKIDSMIEATYSEAAKAITNHQTEIQYARTVFMKIMASVNHALRGLSQPARPQPLQQQPLPNASEELSASLAESESDHSN